MAEPGKDRDAALRVELRGPIGYPPWAVGAAFPPFVDFVEEAEGAPLDQPIDHEVSMMAGFDSRPIEIVLGPLQGFVRRQVRRPGSRREADLRGRPDPGIVEDRGGDVGQ